MRSWIVISRSSSTVCSGVPSQPDAPTRIPASFGKYLATGSLTISRPSSYSMRAATVTIGLVIDAMLKIASFDIGVRASGSR
jgi:hypothetical protein